MFTVQLCRPMIHAWQKENEKFPQKKKRKRMKNCVVNMGSILEHTVAVRLGASLEYAARRSDGEVEKQQPRCWRHCSGR